MTVWKATTDSGTPTSRVLRADVNKSIYWWISVVPTSANWQTHLQQIRIGTKEFTKPDHTHCLYHDWPAADTTPYMLAGGFIDSLPTLYDWTARYPNGDPVPYAVHEYYVGTTLHYRTIADINGVFQSVDVAPNFGHSAPVFTADRDWNGVVFRTVPNPRVSTLTGPRTRFLETGGIKKAIWPFNCFQASGFEIIPKDRDWMPPVRIIRNTTTDVVADCYMLVVLADHMPLASITGQVPPQLSTQGSSIDGAGDTLANYFTRSTLTATEAGLYRKKTGYPATYFPPAQRWEACPGSDVTGYTPPANEPSCPFVVKKGTP